MKFCFSHTQNRLPPGPAALRFRRLPVRGFTLIEVLLVVLLIGIIGSIALPRLRETFQFAQIQDASRSAVRMTRYARTMAIVRQETFMLTFNKNGLMTLSGTEAGAGQEERVERRLPEEIRIVRFENKSALQTDRDSDEYSVRFYPAGMNDGYELTLSSARGRQIKIICNPVTGKTTLEEVR